LDDPRRLPRRAARPASPARPRPRAPTPSRRGARAMTEANPQAPVDGVPEDTPVAVVIPAFNAEATLDETLRSVRGQTYRNLEIVVVDDGSTDGTYDLARCHAEADPRLRVLRVENGGVAAARNAGIAA